MLLLSFLQAQQALLLMAFCKMLVLIFKISKPYPQHTQAYMDSSWQNGWTLFYYSWWFAWSPFVGLFIARISYGRSIQEFLIRSGTCAIYISICWMGVFGNAALHQEFLEPGSLSTAINNDITISLFVFLRTISFFTNVNGAINS
jgi:choline/glycine/proline betaine transport protein